MARDIYNMKLRLEEIRRRIFASKKITDHNKAIIQRFYVDIASDLSISRVVFYMNRMWNIARWVKDSKLDEMSESDIKELVAEISYMDYKPRTKLDHNQTLKKLFASLDGEKNNRAASIRTNMRRHELESPGELLDKDDIKALIKAALNPRDKALISVLYESGMRVTELAVRKIKEVMFDEHGAIMDVASGKTGPRPVRLVASTPHLANWLEHHPLKGDPEAALWVSIGPRNQGQPLKYSAIRMMIIKVAKRAGVTKKVNPQHFRRSRATHLSESITVPQLENYLGWVRGSRMPLHYIFLSGRDTDPAILKMYGKLPEGEQAEDPMKPQTCFFCEKENSSELDYCMNCRRPLNMRTLLDEQEKEKTLVNAISPEMIEEMIEQKVREIMEKSNEIWKAKPQVIPASTSGKT